MQITDGHVFRDRRLRQYIGPGFRNPQEGDGQHGSPYRSGPKQGPDRNASVQLPRPGQQQAQLLVRRELSHERR